LASLKLVFGLLPIVGRRCGRQSNEEEEDGKEIIKGEDKKKKESRKKILKLKHKNSILKK